MSSKFTGNLRWNRGWKSIKGTREIVKDKVLVRWTEFGVAFIFFVYNDVRGRFQTAPNEVMRYGRYFY